MITILDYGMGNLRSVERAIRHLGFECNISESIASASRLIIPGVGAFGAAMERIEPLRDAIQRFAERGNPILGICLGQQLLFEESEEFGTHRGLGLLKGRVRYFPADLGLKVPHMGWNSLEGAPESFVSDSGVDGMQAYFVHSLYTECSDSGDVAAWTEYGFRFAAAVQRQNIWGMQFHPEKSGEVGMKLLKEFLR